MPKAASVERKPEEKKSRLVCQILKRICRERLVVYTTYYYVTVNLELRFCDVQLYYRRTQEFIFLRQVNFFPDSFGRSDTSLEVQCFMGILITNSWY